MTHPLFKSMGELKSINFRGKGVLGDDAYDLTFANGKVLMSAYLDAQGRMAGGILAPQGAVRPATEKMYVADGMLPSFRRHIISTLPTFDREAHREVLPHHVNVIRLIRLTLPSVRFAP